MAKIAGVYMITNMKNNMKYIGQSNDIERRWQQEVRGDALIQGNRSLIEKAIQKNGKEYFHFEILEELDSVEDRNAAEVMFIKRYNTLTPNGYNICEGGEGGPIGERHSAWKDHPTIIPKSSKSMKQSYSLYFHSEELKQSSSIPKLLDIVKEQGFSKIEVLGEMCYLNDMDSLYNKYNKFNEEHKYQKIYGFLEEHFEDIDPSQELIDKLYVLFFEWSEKFKQYCPLEECGKIIVKNTLYGFYPRKKKLSFLKAFNRRWNEYKEDNGL